MKMVPTESVNAYHFEIEEDRFSQLSEDDMIEHNGMICHGSFGVGYFVLCLDLCNRRFW